MKIEIISAARLFLANKRPYLSTALWSLSFVPVDGLTTMGVDKHWRCYYDPELEWDVTVTAAVLYHEIQHLIRDHMGRGEGREAETWNLAGDCEINDDVKSEGIWKLPENVVYPSTFGLKDEDMAEVYYEAIQKKTQKVQVPDDMPAPGAGNCGSGAGGGARPWEKEDIPGTRKISPAEGDLISRKVAEDINHQKSIGDVPGYWERWAEEYLNPQVDWRKELRATVRNTLYDIVGQVDYTYRRPGRRSSAIPNIVQPSMTQPQVKVCVCVDTSGSMSGDDLAKAVTEVGGILTQLGIRDGVTVLAVDASVHEVKKVFNPRQVKLAGGGGTDMGAGIQRADTLRPRPDVCVVLTDGYTPWPDYPPHNMKVVVGLIGNSDRDSVPSYAKSVVID